MRFVFCHCLSKASGCCSRCVKCQYGLGLILDFHYAQQLGPLFSEGCVFNTTGDFFMPNQMNLYKQLNWYKASGGLKGPTRTRFMCRHRAYSNVALYKRHFKFLYSGFLEKQAPFLLRLKNRFQGSLKLCWKKKKQGMYEILSKINEDIVEKERK